MAINQIIFKQILVQIPYSQLFDELPGLYIIVFKLNEKKISNNSDRISCWLLVNPTPQKAKAKFRIQLIRVLSTSEQANNCPYDDNNKSANHRVPQERNPKQNEGLISICNRQT